MNSSIWHRSVFPETFVASQLPETNANTSGWSLLLYAGITASSGHCARDQIRNVFSFAAYHLQLHRKMKFSFKLFFEEWQNFSVWSCVEGWGLFLTTSTLTLPRVVFPMWCHEKHASLFWKGNPLRDVTELWTLCTWAESSSPTDIGFFGALIILHSKSYSLNRHGLSGSRQSQIAINLQSTVLFWLHMTYVPPAGW